MSILCILEEKILTLYRGTVMESILQVCLIVKCGTTVMVGGNAPDRETGDDTTDQHTREVVSSGLHRAAPQCNGGTNLRRTRWHSSATAPTELLCLPLHLYGPLPPISVTRPAVQVR